MIYCTNYFEKFYSYKRSSLFINVSRVGGWNEARGRRRDQAGAELCLEGDPGVNLIKLLTALIYECL